MPGDELPASISAGQPGEFLGWDCQTCGEATSHLILRERAGRTVLQCNACQTVIKVQLPRERVCRVPLVISDMASSYKQELELYSDEILAVGDQLFHGEHNLLLTAIEAWLPEELERVGASKAQPRRVESAPAPDIRQLWAKLYDRVRVGVAINRGRTTTPAHLWCAPEEELFVGDELELGGEKVVVVSFKTEHVRQREGSVPAGRIKRLYCRPLKGQRSRDRFENQKHQAHR